MKNSCAIGSLCKQTIKVCELIESITCDIESFEQCNNHDLIGEGLDLRLDELEHLQRLTIALTGLIVDSENEGDEDEGETNTDCSAFSEGELTSVKNETDSKSCKSEE